MTYQINIRKRAIKVLQSIHEPYYTNIKGAIYDLAKNPRPQGYKKLKGRDAYRIRVADYRIIYEIIDNKLLIEVLIWDIGKTYTIERFPFL
jgi:mRNA interferase RelE/StbE